jgi:hypothetical protein
MFHQANLRQADVSNIEINGVSAKLSLLQAWVETVLQEMIRLYVSTFVAGSHLLIDAQDKLANHHLEA